MVDEIQQKLILKADVREFEKLTDTMGKVNKATGVLTGGFVRLDDAGNPIQFTLNKLNASGDKIYQTYTKLGNSFQLTSTKLLQGNNAYKDAAKVAESLAKAQADLLKANIALSRGQDQAGRLGAGSQIKSEIQAKADLLKANIALARGEDQKGRLEASSRSKQISNAEKLANNEARASIKAFNAFKAAQRKEDLAAEKDYYNSVIAARKATDKTIIADQKAFDAFEKARRKAARDEQTAQNKLDAFNAFGGGKPKKPGIGTDREAAAVALGNLQAQAVQYVANGLKQGAKDAIEFERALYLIQQQSGETGKSTQELGRHIFDLSKEFSLPAADIAAAQLSALRGRMGDAGKAEQVLRAGLLLGRLTFSDSNAAVKTLDESLNAFSLSEKQADKTAAILYSTVKNGVGNLDEVKEVFGEVGAVAAPMGVKIEEISALFQEFTRRGIPAGQVGNQLAQMFVRLNAPTEDTIRAFHRLGVDSFQQLIQSSGGTIEAFQKLKGSLKDVGEGYNNLFGGSKTGRPGSEITDELLAGAIKSLEKLKHSQEEASKAAEDLSKNVGQELKDAIADAENQFLKAGDNALIFFGKLSGGEAKSAFSYLIPQLDVMNTTLKSDIELLEKMKNLLKGLAPNLGGNVGVGGKGVQSAIDASPRKPFNEFKDSSGNTRFTFPGDIGTLPVRPQPKFRVPFGLDGFFRSGAGQPGDDINNIKGRLEGDLIKEKLEQQKISDQKNKASIDQRYKDQISAIEKQRAAYFKYVEQIEAKEKDATAVLKNELKVRIDRQEDEFKKIREVQNKANSENKKSQQEEAKIKESISEGTYKRNLQLLKEAPNRVNRAGPTLEQFQNQHLEDLKRDASALIEGGPRTKGIAELSPDEFLNNGQIELARKKLQEYTTFSEEKYQEIFNKFKEGKASEQDLNKANQDILDAKQKELDLEKAIQEVTKKKEENAKKLADAEELRIDNLKSRVKEVFDFKFSDEKGNPKFKSKEEALNAFNTIREEISKNVKGQEGVGILTQIDAQRNIVGDQADRFFAGQRTNNDLETARKAKERLDNSSDSGSILGLIKQQFNEAQIAIAFKDAQNAIGSYEKAVAETVPKIEGWGKSLDSAAKIVANFSPNVTGVSDRDKAVAGQTIINGGIQITIEPDGNGKVSAEQIANEIKSGIRKGYLKISDWESSVVNQ